jgi:hypothetical protein
VQFQDLAHKSRLRLSYFTEQKRHTLIAGIRKRMLLNGAKVQTSSELAAGMMVAGYF